MTTVVGCAAHGVVYMAADTCITVFERPVIGAARKIVRIPVGDGEAVLGMAGDPGLFWAVPKHLDVETPGEDLQDWASGIAAAVTQIGVEAGLVEDGKLDANVLLGYGGRLWTISHGSAIPHPDGRAALGSGQAFAIGALDALLNRGVSPAVAVHDAARIACRHDLYSQLPLQFDKLGDPTSNPATNPAPNPSENPSENP